MTATTIRDTKASVHCGVVTTHSSDHEGGYEPIARVQLLGNKYHQLLSEECGQVHTTEVCWYKKLLLINVRNG